MPSYWHPTCGDGYRDDTEGEEWDDNNNIDNDGWSSLCKIESNYACSNATVVDICTTIYKAPKIISSAIDLEKLKITIEFDQIMANQELTKNDLTLDVFGVNEPYSVTWSASFDQKKLTIDFTCSPAMIGGSNDEINLELINIINFKTTQEIPLQSAKQFIFTVHDLPPAQSVKDGGSGTSFLFIILMLLSLLVSILTGGSIELMWSLANTLQLMFYFNSLDLNFTPELKEVFSYMKYSNFDNPVFEYMRDLSSTYANTDYSFYTSDLLDRLNYSSFNIIINFIDKIVFVIIFICIITIKFCQNK